MSRRRVPDRPKISPASRKVRENPSVADVPLDASVARELRDALGEARYRPEELRRLLRGSGAGLVGRRPPLPVLRLEARGDPLAALIRLLVLAQPVEEERLAVSAALLERSGLVERRDGVVSPLVVLLAYGDLLLACDRPGVGADEVICAGVESERLAALTPRRSVSTALEIGTGGGYEALFAAAHAEHVVGTDISSRALAFARFNAALNGVTNVELRAGSFFEPVEGERFDLVVSNPPYAVSPESRLVYRDSGLARDEVSGLVVHGAAEALQPGGFAVVAASWIVADDLLETPRRWLAGTGCDAWVFHIGTESALAAAVAWNYEVPEEERTERVGRWLDYYRSEGIDSLAYGVLVMRHSGAKEPWLRVVRLPRARSGPRSGAHVERMFRGADLAERGPGKPAEGVSLHVRRRWNDGGWEDEDALFVSDDGIPFRLPADGDGPHRRRLVELGLLEPAALDEDDAEGRHRTMRPSM
jgi:methylase of polypeptide subunit release factors